MNIKDLVPVSTLGQLTGVKMIAYGPPGSGKTPIAATAPRPVILAVESGMLSMRGVDNIPAYKADTAAKIADFMQWWFTSKEAEAFDTLVVDSLSHLSQVILESKLASNKHGMAAYGEMGELVYKYATDIFNQPERHAYLIAQQGFVEENGVQKRRPEFCGQRLNKDIPHLFDLIAHIDTVVIPGVAGMHKAIRCKEGFDVRARDRSGKLDVFEQPDLSKIFSKMLS